MSTDRDTTRIVRSWLEEGATALPDRVLDAVLDQLPATSQRQPLWSARRFSDMNTAWKLAIAAAAVVVVAIVGINLLPMNGGIVAGPGPSPTPNPTQPPSPSPSPSPSPGLPNGSLAPGTYWMDDPCCVGSQQIFLTVPAGWEADDTVEVHKNVLGSADFDPQVGVFATSVGNVYTGGCQWNGTALDPPVGPSVDDFATALAAQAGPGASPPTDVTVGGYPAKKVELVIPDSVDMTKCDTVDGSHVFGRWSLADNPTIAGPWTYGNGKGQHDTVYLVDVGGARQVIYAMYRPGTSAANLAELEQIIASIRFEPRPTTPSPSP